MVARSGLPYPLPHAQHASREGGGITAHAPWLYWPGRARNLSSDWTEPGAKLLCPRVSPPGTGMGSDAGGTAGAQHATESRAGGIALSNHVLGRTLVRSQCYS